MPPRKRARHSTRHSTTPLQETQPKASTPSAIPEKLAPFSEAISNLQSDPWTEEEETLLFKGLVRWKPTGIHKHFRMLSIFEHFRSHGFASGLKDPPAHIRMPGIWAKLYTLYDLDALDQRENVYAGIIKVPDSEDDAEENEEEEEVPVEFRLPEAPESVGKDFGDMMWQRRFATGQDEAFTAPEIVKGLSHTKSLPGVKLQVGKEEEGDNEEENEEEDEEEANDEEDEEDEDEEQEEEESEEDEDEDEESEEEGKKVDKKTTNSAKRGSKNSKKAPEPKRRASRRR